MSALDPLPPGLSWSQAWSTLDTQDGSHTFYNYDQGSAENFSVVALLYNSAGTLTTQIITWDDEPSDRELRLGGPQGGPPFVYCPAIPGNPGHNA